MGTGWWNQMVPGCPQLLVGMADAAEVVESELLSPQSVWDTTEQEESGREVRLVREEESEGGREEEVREGGKEGGRSQK